MDYHMDYHVDYHVTLSHGLSRDYHVDYHVTLSRLYHVTLSRDPIILFTQVYGLPLTRSNPSNRKSVDFRNLTGHKVLK
jgi:hypothetical protein